MLCMNTPRWDRAVVNQYMAAISGSLAYAIMGAATAWPSPTLVEMKAHRTPVILDVSQISWMVSIMFIGHISSPIPSGYLMEWFGRKKTCLWLTTVPFISWLFILYATYPVHLYIARFLAGMWIGAITTIIPLYVGEVAGPKLRGSLTTLNNLFLNFGVMYVYIIGPFVTYSALAIFCAILTVVFFCTYAMMPESPYYLIKREKKEEAFKVLSWLRKGESAESIHSEIQRIEQSIDEQKVHRGTLKDILKDEGNRKALVISITYSVLKRTTGSNVMQAFMSITLPKKTFQVLTPNICVIIIGIISLVSAIASTGLAAKFRRRTLMTVSSGVCALATAVIAVWFFENNCLFAPVTQYSDIIFLSVAVYYAGFNISLGPIGTSIKGEMFATNVKALSSSITTLTVAFAGFFMSKFYLIIAQSIGMYVNYIIYSISCVVAIVFTWQYVPDTHNKTLEEVQHILRGRRNWRVYSSTSKLLEK